MVTGSPVRGLRGDKLPPYSQEAEEMVLGGLIMSQGEAFPAVAAIIGAADFYSDQNQAIFEVIERFFNEQRDIDRVTVAYELQVTGKEAETGGERYISHLIEVAIGVAHEDTILYHARIIKDTSILRRLLSMMGMAEHQINTGKKSKEVIEFIQEFLNRFEEESRVLVIDSLSIIKSDPPIYRAKVWGINIDFTLDEITSWIDMRRRIISVCDRVPTKHRDHDQFIHNALANAAKIEAPLDASTSTQIQESIERFFDRNVPSDDHADLSAGSYMVKAIDDVEHLLFFPRPLKRWLKQDLEHAYTESALWAFISQRHGQVHTVRVKKGKGATQPVKLWAIPRTENLLHHLGPGGLLARTFVPCTLVLCRKFSFIVGFWKMNNATLNLILSIV